MAFMIEGKELGLLIERNKEQFPELNSALILAAAIWGVKAGELSLIEVADVISNKGAIKKKWMLRAENAFNGHARELYAEHERLVEYLDAYLNWRVKQGQGVTNIGEYRGLDPESRLFLTTEGNPFAFSRRELADGKVNMQPVGMNAYFKRLIKNAGLADKGITYKVFRRSLATQMWRAGDRKTGVMKDIMKYLGLRSYSALRKILASDKKHLHEMIKGIHKRI
ncbi:MAG: hypothetical protein KZQ99_06480 [Candidatus Thiodiazotropha sp. (ex Dulcina madagascariensis)]|nr:hypothetical protein [Candidatus Thiodiazotropha sp. (ex Dulcina madagascariensis)]